MSYLDSLFSLEGKVAVVTGAARGLGLAMTEALLKAGAHVIMVGSNEQRINETADEFQSDGLPASAIACDLGNREQLSSLTGSILARERLDVLVNNAGVTFTHELSDYPDDAWSRTFAGNYRSILLISCSAVTWYLPTSTLPFSSRY